MNHKQSDDRQRVAVATFQTVACPFQQFVHHLRRFKRAGGFKKNVDRPSVHGFGINRIETLFVFAFFAFVDQRIGKQQLMQFFDRSFKQADFAAVVDNLFQKLPVIAVFRRVGNGSDAFVQGAFF